MLTLLGGTEVRRPRPPNLQPLSQRSTSGRRTFAFGQEATSYTNDELLKMCGYSPELGGSVDRSISTVVTVTVLTD